MGKRMNPPLLTVFAIPKAFGDRFRVIQRNVLQSWLSLGPSVEVLLLGDDPGTAETADEFGVTHLPHVERNRFGTPTVSSIFELAQDNAHGSVMVYVNADIILFRDIVDVAQSISYDRYLLSSQRWNLDISTDLDFDANWEARVRKDVEDRAQPAGPEWIDLFMFPKGLFRDIPPFGIGRARWDNWMMFAARSRGIPVVDATPAMTIVHQNHDYSHHPQGIAGTHAGAEADWNVSLARGIDYIFTLEDVDWVFDGKKFHKPDVTYRRMLRKIRNIPALHPCLAPILRPAFTLGRKLFRT